MEIVIRESAYKHGLTDESIYACLYNFQRDRLLDDPPPKRLFVGFDHIGRALEIIAIEDTVADRLVVIHAMKLQKKYSYLLQEGTYEL